MAGGCAAEDYDFQEFKSIVDVNVNGTFLFAKAAGKHMIDEKIKGNIIMVSSMSASIVNKPQKQSAYNAVCILYPSLGSFMPFELPPADVVFPGPSPKPPLPISRVPSRLNGASTA